MRSLSSWRHRFQYLGHRMRQQKVLGENDMKTELHRCLSTTQLTFLGVGNTIGVGIYVMLGVMAKENAGPSVILCFLAAIFVTLMNALVFAEFATYVPQTGASYIYIYKVFGEFAAFLCGWTSLITYTFASSVGAQAWSGMLDSFFNNSIQAQTNNILGKIQFGMPFAESLNVLALAFQIAVVVIVSCNVLCSSVINTILGVLTSSVLIFVFVAGMVYGNPQNFLNADHGGFFPFGFEGVIKGTSLAIYAMSGFEIVSLSAEEAKDPVKAVPRALIFELLIVGTVYIGAAVGMLFLIPYWLIDLRSPMPSAFDYSHLSWGKFVVTVGPMFGVTNLQMLGIYGVSRVMYRMSKDGLFFKCFLNVNKKTGVPLNSVVCVGVMTSIFALLFDLSYIVKITVMLMLINYMVVGSALIKLTISEAGEPSQTEKADIPGHCNKTERDYIENEVLVSGGAEDCSPRVSVVEGNEELVPSESLPGAESIAVGSSHILDTVKNYDMLGKNSGISENSDLTNELEKSSDDSRKDATSMTNTVYEETEDEHLFKNSSSTHLDTITKPTSFHIDGAKMGVKHLVAACLSPFFPGVLSVNLVLVLHWIACVSIAMQINFGWEDISQWKPVSIISLIVLVVLLLVLSFFLWSQCHRTNKLGFQTPLMPFVPTVSLLSSTVLMFSSGDLSGFIEVVILVVIGAVVYILMVLFTPDSGHRLLLSGGIDERNSLLAGSGDDADDEIESDEI